MGTYMKVMCLVFFCFLLTTSCYDIPKEKKEPDVIFATTPHRIVREMLQLAHVTKDDVVYDLGSGDGRIVIAAAKDFGARGVGIEIDQELVQESMKHAKEQGVSDRVTFVAQDIFQTDISRATVVTLYMLPELNTKLLPKLLKELQPGARIVSHKFGISNWKPDMTLEAYDSKILFWTVPAVTHGEWHLTLTNERMHRTATLKLKQRYQETTGTFSDGTRNLKISHIKIYGKEFMMTVADTKRKPWFLLEIESTIHGNTMAGTARLTENNVSSRYIVKGFKVSQ